MNPLAKLHYIERKLHQAIRSPVPWKERRMKKWCRKFNSAALKIMVRKRRLAMSSMLKELFITAADFREWQKDQTEGQLYTDMGRAILSIEFPSYFPAILVFRWITTQSGIVLLSSWVNHEDFKSEPVTIERVQDKHGRWVEKKVPRKPAAQRPVDMPIIRAIELD